MTRTAPLPTVAEIRADLKPQTVYVRDGAGRWVYYTDTCTKSAARLEAEALSARGVGVWVSDHYRGPEITGPGGGPVMVWG